MVGLKSDFLIIDPDDQLTIVKRILKDEVKENNFYTDKPKAIVNFINKCKDEGKRSLDIIINNENRFKQLIYSKYEKYIQQENKLDFGELILLTKGLSLFLWNSHIFSKKNSEYKYKSRISAHLPSYTLATGVIKECIRVATRKVSIGFQV